MSGHSKGHNIKSPTLTVSRGYKKRKMILAQYERNEIHKNQ